MDGILLYVFLQLKSHYNLKKCGVIFNSRYIVMKWIIFKIRKIKRLHVNF